MAIIRNSSCVWQKKCERAAVSLWDRALWNPTGFNLHICGTLFKCTWMTVTKSHIQLSVPEFSPHHTLSPNEQMQCLLLVLKIGTGEELSFLEIHVYHLFLNRLIT